MMYLSNNFIFNLPVSLYLKWISYRYPYSWVMFFNPLCHFFFIHIFRSCTFHVIFAMWGLKSVILFSMADFGFIFPTFLRVNLNLFKNSILIYLLFISLSLCIFFGSYSRYCIYIYNHSLLVLSFYQIRWSIVPLAPLMALSSPWFMVFPICTPRTH